MPQLYNEQFLPAELQAQIGTLRDAGVSDAILAHHIETILSQMEAKTTKVQLDVWRIEESLGERMEKATHKIEADLRTALGETNGMLAELLGGQREQGAATEQLRAEFQTFGEHLSERMGGLEGRMDASEHDRRDIHDAIRDLDTRHGGQIAQIAARLLEIERLMEVAGNHHQDEHNRHEAGG